MYCLERNDTTSAFGWHSREGYKGLNKLVETRTA
jgi:hypothetical protein